MNAGPWFGASLLGGLPPPYSLVTAPFAARILWKWEFWPRFYNQPPNGQVCLGLPGESHSKGESWAQPGLFTAAALAEPGGVGSGNAAFGP